MAYISQEMKAQVAPAIKTVLKKYGMKGTISVRNHMTLKVTLTDGPLIFKSRINEFYPERCGHPQFVIDLVAAMKTPTWENNSDVQSDYFDITYYLDIEDSRRWKI